MLSLYVQSTKVSICSILKASSHPMVLLIRRIDELVVQQMDISLDPLLRAATMLELQEALRLSNKSRVKLTQAVHDQLTDFEFLTTSLGERPTRIEEIVPSDPAHMGASDAARPGYGRCLGPRPALSPCSQLGSSSTATRVA
jgi:hypothetical protein